MISLFYDYIIIKISGLFDPFFYLMCNVDVRRADIDPLWHFCTVGWKEGRKPAEWFDTHFYLKTYLDVKLSEINPLLHYIKYGKKEGRITQPYHKFYQSSDYGGV